ncbi:MAG: hypothetical protein JRN19_07365 [Nitrososphaerota archaeon]|nr:hypothetical protein [Nitrososphaerota archaeon]
MRESSIAILTYVTMIGVPVLLWVLAVTGPFMGLHFIRTALLGLTGIGAIIFGAVGINEVFIHGKKEPRK